MTKTPKWEVLRGERYAHLQDTNGRIVITRELENGNSAAILDRLAVECNITEARIQEEAASGVPLAG